MQGSTESVQTAIASGVKRNRQWKALVPIIIEEQGTALILFSILLFVSLLLLSFWSLKRLTKPLRDLAFSAEIIGKGSTAHIPVVSGGALGKLEQAMSSMQEELIKLRARAHAQGMETAWRDIARVMAHEIKNPLTPIQLTLDRIQERIDNGKNISPEELTKFVNRMGSQVTNLEQLVNDFRSFSKEPEPNCKPVQLLKCFEYLNQELGSIAVTIRGDSIAHADEHLLNRVLLNLWKNSLEAGATELNIVISEIEQYVDINLRDNGPGIPAADIERIWIPYFTTKKTGTGLGLPVVKRLVESMGGMISLRSSAESGIHGVETQIRLKKSNFSQN
jgi:nitrogen fixation/metabolism regulation signal transduction histidine kinase